LKISLFFAVEMAIDMLAFTSQASHAQHDIAVVLNRGCTYPLGVPNTATGGTKHQHFYAYTPWKFWRCVVDCCECSKLCQKPNLESRPVQSFLKRSLSSTQCSSLLHESAVAILCSSAYMCSWAAQRNRAVSETRR